jgi:5'-deoxynucleotidase YfbR-like HD superfamily hydrolase
MARAPHELSFLLEAESLKLEPRRGWQRIGVPRPESVADHSWRLALMAMLYADMLGLDTGKAARIALLHDLPEARTGDSMPGEWSARQKHVRERRALAAMLKPLPTRMQQRWLALWMEYEEGSSAEARLVAELDKVEMVAQGLAYERRGAAKAPDLDGFWATAERAVVSTEMRARLSALHAQRPRARRASSSSPRGRLGSRKRNSRSPRTR